MRIHSVLSITHCDPVSPGVARGHAAGSKHQGLSLTGLGKEGAIFRGSTSLRPLGELAYLRTAYSHYSPVMIATFRRNITILEELDKLGGSLDGSGSPENGYVLRGGRMLESKYLCTYELPTTV